MRPVVLMEQRPAAQSAAATPPQPETVRALTRRVRHQGTLGLVPEHPELLRPRRGQPVPAAVVAELARLQALDEGWGARALARMLGYKRQARIDDKPVKRLGPQQPRPVRDEASVGADHRHADRYPARLQVVNRSSPGGTKSRIRHLRPVSRPTSALGMPRVEAEHVAGLEDQSRAPPPTPRTVWLPLMRAIDPRPTRPPEAGAFRLWRVLATDPSAVRTVGRVMALNQHVEDAIPPVAATPATQPPGPHPDTAPSAHHAWCSDGRMMDGAGAGGQWWSLRIRAGSSRPRCAGAMAPAEASGAALPVLSTAGRRSGVPQALMSERGGASLAPAFDAVGTRLELDHQTSIRTQGARDLKVMETQCHMQRRLDDDQVARSPTPAALEQAHPACIRRDTTTAHQGRLDEGCDPPMPLAVRAAAKGRTWSPDGRAQQFSRALLPRMTNRYGGVTLPRSPVDGAAG
jgi:hypothetical protein